MPPERLHDETDLETPADGEGHRREGNGNGGNGNGNGGNHNGGNGDNGGGEEGKDLELAKLIEVAESQQVPALLETADATHTVLGADGPRWRFDGEGTPAGDEVLLDSLRAAVRQIDAKREREADDVE